MIILVVDQISKRLGAWYYCAGYLTSLTGLGSYGWGETSDEGDVGVLAGVTGSNIKECALLNIETILMNALVHNMAK